MMQSRCSECRRAPAAGRRTGSLPGGDRRLEGGFSIVEVLLASFFLLIISLGVVPIFVQSTQSNLAGHDSTRVSNFARSRLEEFMQQDFGSPALSIEAGNPLVASGVASLEGGDSLVFTESLDQWTRTTTIRQYGYVDGGGGTLVLDWTPLPAGSPAENVDVKEIVVAVQSTRAPGPLTAGKSISVRTFKSQ